jgi:ribonuclease P protein component
MEELFKKGKHANASPLKAVYLPFGLIHDYPVQVMFVVPKKLFKRANDRNKLKRRMREAYRLQKSSLYERLKASEKKFILALIYTAKEAEDYKKIEAGVSKLTLKLI